MSHPETLKDAAIGGLLDSALLSGQYEVTTILRPERPARPLAVDDWPGLFREIELACQLWGGGSQPFLPVKAGRLPDAYDQLLRVEQIDVVGGRQPVEIGLPSRVRSRRSWDHPAILVAAREPVSSWRTVQIVDLDVDDPWRPIYDAVLGTWPDAPDAALSEFAGLREDLQFDEIVPVERVTATGSLDDLIKRLRDWELLTPRDVANTSLAFGLLPDTSFMGVDVREQVLPNPRTTRRAAGPNLIVVVSRGSVEDVSLLWNLRGAHGGGRVMPIGVPAGEIGREHIRELQSPGRATSFGFGGGKCHLVSATVPLEQLERLAAESSIEAVPYEQVLTFGPAPGRHRSHVAVWQDGRTRLNPMSDADYDVLRESMTALRKPHLILDVAVEGHPLPTDHTMRGSDIFLRYQAGAAQVAVSDLRRERTLEVAWPSAWTCLAAVAQTRGLDVKESEPGLAAITLIRSLGSVNEVRLLQHRPLIALMYRMAERSGMSWWKKRWAEAHRRLLDAGADPTTLAESASVLGRDNPVVAPAGEGRAVPFQDFVNALGNETAASRWVTWAERRHLIVRGASVACPYCKTRSWLPTAALPPPVPCPGCGRHIEQPYGPRELRFAYRIGEPLRRVLETDSLGHVLALHWFVQLFDRAGLVGGHPGVTFTDPTNNGKTVGEADVVLLFEDGTLVPVEVKRRLAGADERTASLMDSLADALDAPWDALAVTQPARDVPTLPERARTMPARPRVVLTDDQLHADHIFWAMGANPFAWEPRTAEDDADRESSFARQLGEHDPDVPWNDVEALLLDRRHDASG